MFPLWLKVLSWIALIIGVGSAVIAAYDVSRHPQQMAIMNVVWPTTALFGGPLTLWMYFRYGRLATHSKVHAAMQRHEDPPSTTGTPFAIMVAKGASHCGSGCMIGDIVAEWMAFLVPAIAVWLGWHTIFADKMYAVWLLDFVFAFSLGILFQYFAIVPMRNLSPGEGIIAAIKADTLSLVAWQAGMYGFMAFAQLYLLEHLLGHRAEVDTPEFWFMMQIAMIAGFATAYPVNWWLIRSGIKEEM
jgi:hypothetical protein